MSTFRVNTTTMQDLISKAMKGAGNSKMHLITSMIEFKLEKNVLQLTTTDAINHLMVSSIGIEGEDCIFVTDINMISKLILKMTSPEISFNVEPTSVTISGNGEYTIPFCEEDGECVAFPKPEFDYQKAGDAFKVDMANIHSILESNKHSLAKTLEMPQLTGYYIDVNRVISATDVLICSNKINTFGIKMLIHPEFIELLNVIPDKEAYVKYYDDYLYVSSLDSSIEAYGRMFFEDIETYPIKQIDQLLDTAFSASCVLSKANLLSLLDRIGIFVNEYDESTIQMTFEPSKIIITSKDGSANEVIKYTAIENYIPFNGNININHLKTQVSVQPGDSFKLWFGNENCIKLESENVAEIIALVMA